MPGNALIDVLTYEKRVSRGNLAIFIELIQSYGSEKNAVNNVTKSIIII